MNIVMVGAGNVATHLGRVLVESGHNILQVYSRTIEHANVLSKALDAHAISDLSQIETNADLILISVTDDAILTVADAIPYTNALVAHTAGSVSIEALKRFPHHGVFYPFQTFSKDKAVDFLTIPILLEGCSEKVAQTLQSLGNDLSQKVILASSSQRKQLHISAVFACNFVNHFYHVAHQVLDNAGLPFELLLPLIKETASKVESMAPFDAQTGPAVRNDQQVIESHQKDLVTNLDMAKLYQLVSESILKMHNS